MENPHPFQAAVLRPDWLACRGSLSHCYPGDKKAICLLAHNARLPTLPDELTGTLVA
jgi:hypothetical protein